MAAPCGTWDLGSQTKDGAHTLCMGRRSQGTKRGSVKADGVHYCSSGLEPLGSLPGLARLPSLHSPSPLAGPNLLWRPPLLVCPLSYFICITRSKRLLVRLLRQPGFPRGHRSQHVPGRMCRKRARSTLKRQKGLSWSSGKIIV